MKRILLVAFAALLLAAPAVHATALDTTLFSKKSVLTISGYAGSTTLANFPVLVRLAADSPSGFDYADCAADGSDLRFADASGDLIPHEIDTWNTSGESLVWVSVPSISGTATTFTMYYGADNVSSLPAVTESDVWTGANFNAVWHFSGSSKESANGLTPSSSDSSSTPPGYTATTFGVGTCFKASNSTLGYLVSDTWTTLGTGGTLTLSTWSKFDGSSANYNRMLSCMSDWSKPAGWELTIQNVSVDQITVGSSGQSQFQYTASGVGPGSGNVYLTVVYNAGGNTQLYTNGVLATAKTLNQVVKPTEKLYIGSLNKSGNRWNGSLDEIRIHRDAESADWVKACYDTMASASFLTMDAVAAPSGEMPLAIRSNDATLSGTTATITGRLSNLGTGATSADVTLYYGTTSDVESGTAVGPTTYTDKADLSNTLDNLTPAATYYYAYKAVNNAPTPETAWTATNSFVVEASTRFSDTLAIAKQNCQMTVTGTMTAWGIGTTAVELLVGTSAGNLSPVQTVNLSAAPANMEVAFDTLTRDSGTYYVAIRATTTYNDIVWVRETAATSVTLADTSTYTWKGGKGAWSDAAMWTTTEAGGAGYPTAGCSVVFPMDAKNDNVVYLSSNPGTLASIIIDSASRYTFRSTSRSSVRTVKGTTMTMSGAGGGTLVLDAVSFLGAIANDRNSRFTTLAGLGRLVLENSSEIDPPRETDNSQLELTLVNGGMFRPWWVAAHVGKLNVGRSLTRIAPYGSNGITFDRFENIGDLGYCQLNSDMSGKVSFTDVSGITQIGGDGTYENNPSQIKVAPEFSFYNGGFNKGIAAISNNVVVALAPETMKQGFDGASSLDNVYVASATTLTEDKTVNAVLLNADVDLNGHTLTVVSGVVRMSLNGNGHLQNGSLRVLHPGLVTDNTGNSVVRFSADVETAGNADPWAPMLDTYMYDGNQMFSFKLTNFVGRIFWPQWQFSLKTGREAMGYVVDIKKAGQSVKSTQNYQSCVVRGIAGDCKVEIGALNSAIWIGDCTDDQWSQIGNYKFNVVVSTNGMMAPGMFSYDGGRRGSITMKGAKERLTTFKMDEGGTLQVAIHADGEASQLKMTEMDSGDYINVTLAGTLDIREYGKIQTGVAYPVVLYHPGSLTGKFSRKLINGAAPSGASYEVKYDVPQDDGSYAVTVTRRPNGTVIVVR